MVTLHMVAVSDGGDDDDSEPIDCLVLGSRTYEHALELGWPCGDTPTVVMTTKELPSIRSSVEFRSGDLKEGLSQPWPGRRDQVADHPGHVGLTVCASSITPVMK